MPFLHNRATCENPQAHELIRWEGGQAPLTADAAPPTAFVILARPTCHSSIMINDMCDSWALDMHGNASTRFGGRQESVALSILCDNTTGYVPFDVSTDALDGIVRVAQNGA